MLGKRRGGHVGLHTDGHRNGAATDVRKALGHRGRVGIIQSHAAVFEWLVDPKQAELAHFSEHLMGGEDLGLLPFIDMRVDLGIDEFLQCVLQCQMLRGIRRGGELIHGAVS